MLGEVSITWPVPDPDSTSAWQISSGGHTGTCWCIELSSRSSLWKSSLDTVIRSCLAITISRARQGRYDRISFTSTMMPPGSGIPPAIPGIICSAASCHRIDASWSRFSDVRCEQRDLSRQNVITYLLRQTSHAIAARFLGGDRLGESIEAKADQAEAVAHADK